MEQWFVGAWYHGSRLGLLLVPFSWLFSAAVRFRRFLYSRKLLPTTPLPVPVIVVGNIVVGGSGKTSFVVWLVDLLKANGYYPGVLSRGYGGGASFWPQQVRPDSDPFIVGDEPVMLARRCSCPVVVDPDRVRGGLGLLEHNHCDVIVCDDGLQHYRLPRDIEVVLVDGVRRYGNSRLLPAGPLREPVGRLQQADFVVVKGRGSVAEYPMRMVDFGLVAMTNPALQCEPAQFEGHQVHAVAGIANPQSFFGQLRVFGMEVIEHPFPDHYHFTAADVRFNDDLPVIMTEKDAVKCSEFADSRFWVLSYAVEIEGKLEARILNRLAEITESYGQEAA